MYVTSATGSVTSAANLSWIATPDFMSEVPQPYSSPPSTRDGRLPATGTVSMCPASATRYGRPRSVRATTALPSRSTNRWPRARSAASMASASGPSEPLTDSMSTSCAVSSDALSDRSSFTPGSIARRREPLALSRARSFGRQRQELGALGHNAVAARDAVQPPAHVGRRVLGNPRDVVPARGRPCGGAESWQARPGPQRRPPVLRGRYACHLAGEQRDPAMTVGGQVQPVRRPQPAVGEDPHRP